MKKIIIILLLLLISSPAFAGTKTVTAENGAVTDTAQFKFGSTAARFTGTTDKLRITDDADFNFGSGNFTMETFVRYNTLEANPLFYGDYQSTTNREIVWYWNNSDDTIHFGYSTDGSNNTDTGFSNWSPSTGVWYHSAVVRNGNNLIVYADGAQIGSTLDVTGVTIKTNTGNPAIGNDSTDNYLFGGWLDDFRVIKGFAVYTAAFTPPSSALKPCSNGGATNSLMLHMEGADEGTTFTDESATEGSGTCPPAAGGGAAATRTIRRPIFISE